VQRRSRVSHFSRSLYDLHPLAGGSSSSARIEIAGAVRRLPASVPYANLPCEMGYAFSAVLRWYYQAGSGYHYREIPGPRSTWVPTQEQPSPET
jgi:hypothetical protein